MSGAAGGRSSRWTESEAWTMSKNNDRTVCPFFQGNDERCARRFNLQRLSDVFGQCLDAYESCPVYHQLTCAQSDAGAGDDAHAAA